MVHLHCHSLLHLLGGQYPQQGLDPRASNILHSKSNLHQLIRSLEEVDLAQTQLYERPVNNIIYPIFSANNRNLTVRCLFIWSLVNLAPHRSPGEALEASLQVPKG